MNRRVLSIASAGIASSIFATRTRQQVEAKDYLLSPNIQHNFDLNWDKLKPRSGYRDIYLVRHGQYHVKEKKREDKLLTELGHKQAQATGEWFRSRGIKPTEFIISTMPRAKQTAENILTEMGDLVQENTIHRTEMIEEGAPPTAPVPKRKYYESDDYKRYLHADGSRIEAGFRKYIHRGYASEQDENQVAIIVCHANVIRYFLMRLMQVDGEAWLRFGLNHGSVTHVRIFGNGDVRVYTMGDNAFMDRSLFST